MAKGRTNKQGGASVSLTGDAVVAEVLNSKTFYNTDPKTKLTGTMPNKVGSATVITPSTSDQIIPQGYYGGASGDGKVSGDANLISANIKSGANIFGVDGTLPVITGSNGFNFGFTITKTNIGANNSNTLLSAGAGFFMGVGSGYNRNATLDGTSFSLARTTNQAIGVYVPYISSLYAAASSGTGATDFYYGILGSTPNIKTSYTVGNLAVQNTGTQTITGPGIVISWSGSPYLKTVTIDGVAFNPHMFSEMDINDFARTLFIPFKTSFAVGNAGTGGTSTITYLAYS